MQVFVMTYVQHALYFNKVFLSGKLLSYNDSLDKHLDIIFNR